MGIKAKRIMIGYKVEFLWPAADRLHTFHESTVSSPVRVMYIYIFKCTPKYLSIADISVDVADRHFPGTWCKLSGGGGTQT
jgi:hypothetical protein